MAGSYELGLFHAAARSDLAARHFAIAAASGGACAPAAAANLGCMYDRGLGVPRDDARAAHWFARAAEAGDAGAWYRLGVCHSTGTGAARDACFALACFALAASAGDRDAMLALESLCPE